MYVIFSFIFFFFLLSQNPKYRLIKTDSKAFQEKVSGSPAALKLLDIAGFKAGNGTATADAAATGIPTSLELVHSNMAILNLVSQVNVIHFCMSSMCTK
jgi:PUB domain